MSSSGNSSSSGGNSDGGDNGGMDGAGSSTTQGSENGGYSDGGSDPGGALAASGNPGGWGLGGWGMNADGTVSQGVNGGLGASADGLGNALSNLGSYNRTEGGILSGGPLNGWGTLATIAGYALPGVGPAMAALSLGNMALGATNSMGLTNTGELSSPRSVAGSLMDKISSMGSMTASNDQPEAPATTAQSVQQAATPTDGDPTPGRFTSGASVAANEPVRDPSILAAITGLPASVFAKPSSPYALNRKTPELAQGKAQQGIWSALG